METLLKEWTEKFDKIYKELIPKSESYTEKDWQDDGRITELNNCIVGLREAMARQQQRSSTNCAIFDVNGWLYMVCSK